MPGYFQAAIFRVDPATGIVENYVQGVRNSVGFDWHPKTRDLWFGNHARDGISDDMPHDTLHRVSRKGMNFGYPFCHREARLPAEQKLALIEERIADLTRMRRMLKSLIAECARGQRPRSRPIIATLSADAK